LEEVAQDALAPEPFPFEAKLGVTFGVTLVVQVPRLLQPRQNGIHVCTCIRVPQKARAQVPRGKFLLSENAQSVVPQFVFVLLHS
jgi:hypothetical protein